MKSDIIYQIKEENFKALNDKIQKLSKRALKLGLEPISLEIISKDDVFVKSKNCYHSFYNVSINGTSPKLNDWNFIAKVDHDYETPIIRKIPSEELPEELYHSDSSCDHCKTNRYRRITYIVKNSKTNEFKNVGKSCLKDFLGHVDANQYAKYFELFDLIDNEIGKFDSSGCHQIEKYSLDYVLNISSLIINTDNQFVSKSKEDLESGIISTTSLVYEYMFGSICQDYGPVLEEHKQYTAKALEYFKSLSDDSDYIRNCKILLKEKAIKSQDFGLVCSIIGTYFNHLYKEKNKAKICNEYIGNIKDKIEKNIKVNSIKTIDSYYGILHLYNMVDEEGHNLIWFSSNNILGEGREYKLRMTIKDHKEYNGIKQTNVTRCKVL